MIWRKKNWVYSVPKINIPSIYIYAILFLLKEMLKINVCFNLNGLEFGQKIPNNVRFYCIMFSWEIIESSYLNMGSVVAE